MPVVHKSSPHPSNKCKWQACVLRAKIYFCTKGILTQPTFCRSHSYRQWWSEWWITLYLYAQSSHVRPLKKKKKKTHRIGIRNRRLRGHKITKWVSLSSMAAGGTRNNQWLTWHPLYSEPSWRQRLELRGRPFNTNRNHLSVPICCSLINGLSTGCATQRESCGKETGDPTVWEVGGEQVRASV